MSASELKSWLSPRRACATWMRVHLTSLDEKEVLWVANVLLQIRRHGPERLEQLGEDALIGGRDRICGIYGSDPARPFQSAAAAFRSAGQKGPPRRASLGIEDERLQRTRVNRRCHQDAARPRVGPKALSAVSAFPAWPLPGGHHAPAGRLSGEIRAGSMPGKNLAR